MSYNVCRAGTAIMSEWPLTAVWSRDRPRPRDINPFSSPLEAFGGSRSSSQHRLHTHTLLNFPLPLRQERSIRLRPSRLRQKPPPDLHTHPSTHITPAPSTTTNYRFQPSPIPITMSIRRNNVRVSFLFNDSESSIELCVSDDVSCQMRNTNQRYARLGHNRNHLPPSASRRSISRGGSSARGRRSPGPPGRDLGTLPSPRVLS